MLPNPLRNLAPARVNVLLGVILFIVAFGYRLIGIGWGLPNNLHNHSYHPDEPVIFGYAQQLDPLKGDLEPGFYNYATLYLTTLRIATDMAATYGGGLDEKDPASLYRLMSNTHLTGRIITALAGAGTVVLVFFMLRRLTNAFGASMGALLILFAPAHVVHSRFQTPDVLATFLLAASMFMALQLLPGRKDGVVQDTEAREDGTSRGDAEVEKGEMSEEEGEGGPSVLRLAVWAGVFAGLSAGTKYTGILGLLTLWAALALVRRPGWLKAAAVGTGAAILAFIVSTPGMLLNTQQFLKDFRYEMVHTATGHGLTFEGLGNGFSFHMFNLVIGIGLFLTMLGIGGLAVAAHQKRGWALALLAFFVVYFILIGRAEVLFIRYTFPLYIGLAVGFGWLMGMAHDRKGGWTALVLLGIAALIGLDPTGGFRRSMAMTAWMAGEDSRDEAARYLKGLAATNPDMSVGLVRDPWFWSPPLFKNAAAPRWELQKVLAEMQAATGPRVIRYIAPDGSRPDWDMRLLTELKPDYVAISSFDVEEGLRLIGKRGLSPLGKAMAGTSKVFAEQLKKDYVLDRVFGKLGALVHDLEYVRPNIWIYKRKDAATKVTQG